MFWTSLSILAVTLQTGLALPPAMDPNLSTAGSLAQLPSLHQVGMSSSQGSRLAAGSIDSDDFNRASLGAGWTQVAGANFSISGNTLISAANNNWIRRTGLSVDYKDATTEFDLLTNPGVASYTGAVMGGSAVDRLWTKVQSNSGGIYDHIGFYHLMGSSGLPNYGGFYPITPVTGGRVRMYITNAGNTMNIDIDEAHDGVFEYHYESSGIIADLGSVLGTEVGICGVHASADNWALGDGPAGPSLTLTGVCPGPRNFVVSGATPFGTVGLAYGPAGTKTIGGGPCAGMVLDLASVHIAGLFPADINGLMNLNAILPAGACGATVQAVDVSTCKPSNAEVL